MECIESNVVTATVGQDDGSCTSTIVASITCPQTAPGRILLSSQGCNCAGDAIQWIQTSGPNVSIDDEAAQNTFADITVEGEYSFIAYCTPGSG